ncbi:hypothetical protein [Treponema sp.]|uniref:hypothetical protein n=1 Tax=Treponema sp. TaxID=166 RepID=UPI00388FFF51
MTLRPNIFKLGCGIDWFILWLLQWADESNIEVEPELNQCAKQILQNLLGDHIEIKKVVSGNYLSYQQDDDYSVPGLIINEKYFVVFNNPVAENNAVEVLDKQLDYLSGLSEYSKYEKVLIFLSDRIVSDEDKKNILSKGFKYKEWKDLFPVLKNCKSENPILADYVEVQEKRNKMMKWIEK